MSRATVSYCGVELACTFDHEAGFAGDRIDPPYAASASLSSVTVGGVEILDMLTDSQAIAIEELLLASHDSEREAALADYYDALRKDRALEARP